jgi:hypothetical protein
MQQQQQKATADPYGMTNKKAKADPPAARKDDNCGGAV